MRDSNADNVVDQVWSTALDKITKPGDLPSGRPALGDQMDLAAAQAGTAALLATVPAFNKLLYNSGYAASARNTYLILRRLGMPADFFWKYEQWNPKRALDTLDKIVSKVFTTMLSKQHVGVLKLTAADPVTNRFEVSFESCAECSGLHAHDPMCFFHAGSFAGMLAAMLDHEFDAWEVECVALGAAACRFEIGERTDRQTQTRWGRWADEFTYAFEPAARFQEDLDGETVRELGETVDIGYYQMLLASTVLTNMEVVKRSCLDAGRNIGTKLADVVRERFGADPQEAVPAFYRRLRYASLDVTALDPGEASGFRVVVSEAPEHLGVLESSALVPFLSGELEGMLSALTGRDLALATTDVDGHDLVLRYAPR